MGVAGRAVRHHQRGLPGPSRAAGPLGVIGRGRRHVAQPDGAQRVDVHPEFHRRRAVQDRQRSLAELPLTFLPLGGRDLRGVLLSAQPGQGRGDGPVQLAEERVDPRAFLVIQGPPHPVFGTGQPAPGLPVDHRRAQPVTRNVVLARRHRHHQQPSLVQRAEQVGDDLLGIGDLQRDPPAGVLADQEPPELAAAGQIHIAAPLTALTGPGESHPRHRRELTLRQRPRLHQVLRRQPPDQVEPVVAEVLHVDGQVPAQLIQQRGSDLLPMHRVVIAQRDMAIPPGLRIRGDLGQVPVPDAEQPGLLQVRHGDPPAPFQVQVEPVPGHLPQRPPRFVALPVFRAGVAREVSHGQAQFLGDPLGHDLIGQALRSLVQRPVQRPAQLSDLHEIVEMPGLQRGVLAVVDEREQLAGSLVEVAFPGTQRPDDTRSDQRHGRAAALRGQLSQLREVVAAGLLIGRAAAQAEPERARHIGRVGAFPGPCLPARDVHLHRLGQQFHPGRIYRLPGHRVIRQPRIRQPTLDQHLLQRRRPRLVIADEQVAARLVSAAGIVIPAGRIPASAFGIAAGHGQVVLAALAAERGRHQDPLRRTRVAVRARRRDLISAGDVPGRRRLQRHVHVVALGQELMQPEREHRAARRGIDDPRPGLQRVLDRCRARGLSRTGLLSKLARCFGESRRAAAPLRASGRRTGLEAEDLLDPGRQRVSGEGRELFRRRGITETPA